MLSTTAARSHRRATLPLPAIAGLRYLALVALLVTAALLPLGSEARAMKIQVVKSPGGIEAWLVEEHSVPLIAMRFAFDGGSAQDPAGKEGLSHFLTAMMDEGAGELDSETFQERMEDIAMRMSFDDGRDWLYGSFETLSANRDASVDLFRLAVTRPRFDADAVDRVRTQILSNLAYAAKDPNSVASNEWNAAAYPGHAYGRPANGTPQTVAKIMREDIAGYHKRVFAKSGLKVAVVGDIDAKALGLMLDRIFGDLPAKGDLVPVSAVQPKTGGTLKVVEMNVPQSVAHFGLGAMARKDPDFMTAFVMNQIMGGGGFASRLMEEVREKRGLAYSVSSYLSTTQHTSIFAGGVATKNEEIGKSLDVIRSELQRMAKDGPTEIELDNAKKYLTGSYALRFDTSAKIAFQLLGIQIEGLGLDYIDKRNSQIEAVTLADVKRVAAQLLKTDDLIVTIVGKPKNLPSRS